jgi:predicted house-cleaning noncanonical NTP pyrophosphatase (MazG superfamily)
MIIHHQKLVRDQIPEVIKESGKEFSIHRCNKEELISFAKKKLLEEAQEFVERRRSRRYLGDSVFPHRYTEY